MDVFATVVEYAFYTFLFGGFGVIVLYAVSGCRGYD